MRRKLLLTAMLVVTTAAMMLTACNKKETQQADSVAATEASEEEDADAQYATTLLQAGAEAPDFTLNTPEGKPVTLSALRGQYVVIDFWASWCPDCRKDIPAVKVLYDTYASKGVTFLGVSFDTEAEKWTKCIAENEMNWTHVSPLQKWKTKNADGTQQVHITVAKDYGVEWIPSMYLIDPEGRVVVSTVMVEKIGQALATAFQ